MTSFNLNKQKKEAQSRINEKMLGDDRQKFDAKANDDTGNLDWLLKKVRKNKPNDKLYEGQLNEVRQNDDDQVILEAALDNAKNTLNRLRIPDDEAVPLQDYALATDQAARDAFKKADDADKKSRDTSFWDKYVGSQLLGPKTTIVNNNQPSQLLSNYKTRDEMNKENTSKKAAGVYEYLKDADAMLYFIYRTASQEQRELTETESQMVIDINSNKLQALAQVVRPEYRFNPREWDEEARFEQADQMGQQIEQLDDEFQELVEQDASAYTDEEALPRGPRPQRQIVPGPAPF